jgi:hypothetical protein
LVGNIIEAMLISLAPRLALTITLTDAPGNNNPPEFLHIDNLFILLQRSCQRRYIAAFGNHAQILAGGRPQLKDGNRLPVADHQDRGECNRVG